MDFYKAKVEIINVVWPVIWIIKNEVEETLSYDQLTASFKAGVELINVAWLIMWNCTKPG